MKVRIVKKNPHCKMLSVTHKHVEYLRRVGPTRLGARIPKSGSGVPSLSQSYSVLGTLAAAFRRMITLCDSTKSDLLRPAPKRSDEVQILLDSALGSSRLESPTLARVAQFNLQQLLKPRSNISPEEQEAIFRQTHRTPDTIGARLELVLRPHRHGLTIRRLPRSSGVKYPTTWKRNSKLTISFPPSSRRAHLVSGFRPIPLESVYGTIW